MPALDIISPANIKYGTANNVNEFRPPKIFCGIIGNIEVCPDSTKYMRDGTPSAKATGIPKNKANKKTIVNVVIFVRPPVYDLFPQT
jgi:hypothetical protein